MPIAVATHLMFEGAAEEAMNLYVSTFGDSQINQIHRYGPGEGMHGKVKRASFSIAGAEMICIDSSDHQDFTFNPAMSIYVECEDEKELKAAFTRLAEGGEVLKPIGDYGFSSRFGWVKDRFGVSWQLSCD